MPTQKLTKKVCDMAVYGGSGAKGFFAIWDTEVSGFGLRVSGGGEKTFIVSFRVNGKKRMLSIGKYGAITCEQGRSLAREALYFVAGGSDPAKEKIERRRKETVTVADICGKYLELYALKHKKTAGEDQRRIASHIIPRFGRIAAEGLKRSQVVAFHQSIGEAHPYEANRILALLKVIYSRAALWGFVPEGINPARGVEMFKEESRDRWVRPDELPRLTAAIDEEPNIYIRSALWLYLLTGARKRELLSVQWRDVDFDQRQLCLNDTKAGKRQHVILCEPAIEILKLIPRLEGNPFVFPGRDEGKPLCNVDIAFRRIRKKAGLDDVHLHDLRRTCGSWLATGGVSLLHIQKILRHADSQTTQKTYAHLAENPLQAAIEEYGGKIIDLARKRSEVEKAG